MNDIIVSHNNSNNIYVATKTGVWRTINGGGAWENVLVASGGLGCTDLVIRKDKTTDYLFAASSNGSGSAAKIFRNDNASTAAGIWSNVYSESGMDRAAIAISPSNPNVVYAVASTSLRGSYQYGLHAVWRSTSSGDSGTWTTQVRNSDPVKLNTLLFTNPLAATYAECNFAPNSFYSQGDYDMAIAIDPTDENRVWVGGIDLFRSDDGGRNWGLASYWWAEPTDPAYSHADNHIIVFHPNYNGGTNKKMFVGSDGGISRTDDARASLAIGAQATCNPANTSVRWTSLNNNYGVTQFWHGAVFPDGKSYFGGTQDNGTLLGNDTAGANGWKEIYGGDGGYVAIDPTNPNILYSSTPGGHFRKSTDGGKTWGDATFGVDRQTDGYEFITPLAIDPSNPQNMWTGGTVPYRTTNGGANWIKAQAGIYGPNNYRITAIVIAPTDSNYVLAGTRDGYIHRSTEALNTTASTQWKYGRPAAGYVSSVVFDPNDKNIVYATISTFYLKHVWKSINAGESWVSIDGNLPDIPVHCIIVDPTNSSRLFIGTDLGVFVSVDNGASWGVENTGFANTPTESLIPSSPNSTLSLYAFTHGRGVWRVSIGTGGCENSLSATQQIISAVGGNGSVDVSGQSNCNWTASTNVDWVVLVGGISGNGNGKVQYKVAANSLLIPRIGTLTIANKSFTLTQERVVDTSPPQIQIKSPVTTNYYSTTSNSINLNGTTTDDDQVMQIDWVNNRGLRANTSVVGTSSWVLNNVSLEPGLNEIKLTAQDRSGNIGKTVLTIFRMDTTSLLRIAGNGSYPFDGDNESALDAGMAPLSFTHDSFGNVFVVDSFNNRIRRIDAKTGIITTYAGNGEASPVTDGVPATSSALNEPRSIVFDKNSNLFIAEFGSHRIRKVSRDGIITTVAGGTLGFSGDGGLALNSKLSRPTAVLVDSNDNLYIADSANRRIRKINAFDKTINTIVGNGIIGFDGDGGAASNASLNSVAALAFDNDENLYISDQQNHSVRVVSKSSGIITRFAGLAAGNFVSTPDAKLATESGIREPIGIALDKQGNLYIAASSNGQLRRVDAQTKIMTTIAGGDSYQAKTGLSPTSIRYDGLSGVGLDLSGNPMFCSNHGNFTIYKILPTLLTDTISPTLIITSPTSDKQFITTSPLVTLFGDVSDNIRPTHITVKSDRGNFDYSVNLGIGNESWSIYYLPLMIGSNNLTITAWDTAGNSTVKSLNVTYNVPSTLTFLAGTSKSGFNLESGSSLASQLYAPETVAVDNSGNIFIADKGNHRIRKVTRSGVISTVAGNGQIGSSGDSGLAVNAPLNSPNGVAIDNSGNIYIADTNNQRIRKVNAAGIISTIAGSGIQGFAGDGSANPALQQLDTPVGIFLDVAGNLLIADAGNHRIRKLNLTSGVLTTIAGKGYGSGTPDGTAAINSFLRYPTSVVADAAGNIYISNTSGHNIKKINSAGILTNFAGNGTAGFGGDGADAKLAQFNAPGGIALDGAGNLYVTDQVNNCLRKIDASGVISTFAGRGANNNLKDPVIAPADATFNAPAGVVVDRAGNIIVADTNNHRVVMIAAFKNVASVNGASFTAALPVAAESIASAFGNNLAIGSQAATTLPLPTSLIGTTVKVRDSAGVERLAPLFYAGAGQVNYQIPAGTAAGFATIIITNSNGEISTGAVNVATTQPGIFSATSDGAGAAAATLLFIKNSVRTGGAVAQCTTQGCTAIPIDVNAYDDTYLELYGTGIRANSGLPNVKATIGGVTVPVLYAGAHCCFVGVDQINLQLPKSLAGKGFVDVVLTVDGKVGNAVKINVK